MPPVAEESVFIDDSFKNSPVDGRLSGFVVERVSARAQKAGTRLDDTARLRKAVAAYLYGGTQLSEICKEHHLKRTKLLRELRRLGHPLRKGPTLAPDEAEVAVRMWRHGTPRRILALIFDVPQGVIRDYAPSAKKMRVRTTLGGPRRVISDHDRNEVQRLFYVEKKSKRRISWLLDMSTSSVRRILKEVDDVEE